MSINPLYFGTRSRQLFGIYYPASRQSSCLHSVLLCPPIGQEYMRTYMAIRQLATHLSSIGFDVFKFDYYGTGDSAGTNEEGYPNYWIDDVRSAYQELMDVSGVTSISIVGLRFGATMAVEAVAAGLSVDNLLLWDPVINGSEYIRQMRELTLRVLNNRPDSCGEYIENLVGFPFSTSSIRRISEIDLLQVVPEVRRNIFLVFSEESKEYVRFASHLEAEGASLIARNLQTVMNAETQEIHHAHEQKAGNILAQWSDQDEFDQALIAHYAIAEIATLLKSAV